MSPPRPPRSFGGPPRTPRSDDPRLEGDRRHPGRPPGRPGVTMVVPALVGLLYGEAEWWAFAATAAGSLVVGGGLWAAFRPKDELRVREGFAIVALAWFVLSLVGALPWVMTRRAGRVRRRLFRGDERVHHDRRDHPGRRRHAPDRGGPQRVPAVAEPDALARGHGHHRAHDRRAAAAGRRRDAAVQGRGAGPERRQADAARDRDGQAAVGHLRRAHARPDGPAPAGHVVLRRHQPRHGHAGDRRVLDRERVGRPVRRAPTSTG